MGRGVRFIGAALGLILLGTAARADAFWFGDQTTRPLGVGGWYVGHGIIGGLYQLPSWNAPIALFKGALQPDESTLYQGGDRTPFRPLVPFMGSGLTIGRYVPRARVPGWAGRHARVYLSGMYWSGETSESRARTTTFFDALNVSAIDGRTHQNTNYVAGGLEETLRTGHRRLEMLLGAATDYPVASRVTLSPSIALVGGWQRERYRYDAFNRVSGTGPGRPLMYDERNSTIRIGLDAGLRAAARATSTLRLFASLRMGLHWLHTRMTGRDCYDSTKSGTICDVQPGTFTTTRHATSATDSASTWSFRGSLALGLSWDVSPFVVQLGSFFTWESAVPGIRNPVILAVPAGNGTTTIAPARVRFDDGWNAGGFLMIRLPLGAL